MNIKVSEFEKVFPVTGAGEIAISEYALCSCGDSVGFSIGVSWGKYGYSGGVISREEAAKLAYFILEELSKIDAYGETKYRDYFKHRHEKTSDTH
jgi:hypothetical protein